MKKNKQSFFFSLASGEWKKYKTLTVKGKVDRYRRRSRRKMKRSVRWSAIRDNSLSLGRWRWGIEGLRSSYFYPRQMPRQPITSRDKLGRGHGLLCPSACIPLTGAEWKEGGGGAGLAANERMVDPCTKIVAFCAEGFGQVMFYATIKMAAGPGGLMGDRGK